MIDLIITKVFKTAEVLGAAGAIVFGIAVVVFVLAECLTDKNRGLLSLVSFWVLFNSGKFTIVMLLIMLVAHIVGGE